MKTQLRQKLFGLSGIILFILALGWIDWLTGYKLNFFVFYFIPLAITSWFLGLELSIMAAILCTFVWYFADRLSGHNYSSSFYILWNTLIRLSSFLIICWSIDTINLLLRSEKSKAEKLQQALSEIKRLESFLSICCVCKKIRKEDGSWQQMESYISDHSDTRFSHGYCPECAQKAMEEAGLTKKNRIR